MNIILKGLSLSIAISLVATPFSSQAWFLRPANASGIPSAPLSQNVQTMDLLTPALAMASDRHPVNENASVEIVDGLALLPEIGASGTLADIEGSDAGTVTVYIVQPGDSVALVAKMFGVSENTIRWANDMKKTDVLHRGDSLLILPVTGVKYTVASGDTLSAIEKRFGLSSEEIASFLDFNDLEPSAKLVVGQSLIIPGAELAPQATTTTTKKSSTTSTTAKTVSGILKGYFIKPVPSSCRMSQGKHDKYAIDLACPTGTPIRAAASGTVEVARYGWNGAFGHLVVIKHPNGVTTFYAHIKDGGIAITQGQKVNQGDVIAYVGSTGRSTGPHLHFEVRGTTNPGFDYTGNSWKK